MVHARKQKPAAVKVYLPSRFDIVTRYIEVDFTFGLLDYVRNIEEFVISRFVISRTSLNRGSLNRGSTVFPGLIQRAMKSFVTCLFHLYMCVTLFTELFLYINRELEGEENVDVTREEEREESDVNSSESECNFEIE